MGMKKVYINSKKERLKEGKPCTLKINIKDANGNKTEVDVLVKKVELVDETASKYHASISGVTVTGKFHKKIGFESNEKVQLGSKNENNTKENCYKFCTRRERLRRRQLQYWDVIAPQLSVFSIAELIGTIIIVGKAGEKVGGIVETAKIIDTQPIKRPAPPIENINILKEKIKKR